MKHPIMILLLFASLSAGVPAQEQEGNDQTRDTAEKNEAGGAEKDSDKDKKAGETSPDIAENFKPSEEISEDLSVSFPVDI